MNRRSFLASALAACGAAVVAPVALVRGLRVRKGGDEQYARIRVVGIGGETIYEGPRDTASVNAAVTEASRRARDVTRRDEHGRTWLLAEDEAEAFARGHDAIHVETGAGEWRFWTRLPS